MNAGVSSEKERIKESQSRSVTPPLNIHFGCRVRGVTVKAQVNQSVGVHIDLLVCNNCNVAEFDYGCGTSSIPVPNTGVYGDNEDCAYEEANDESDEDVDDESNGDLDVQSDGHVSSFRTYNQVLENEQGIYVFVHVWTRVFYHASPLDGRDSLFVCWKTI